MNKHRAALLNRMKAFARMTVENGASEQEATLALEKLAQMRKQYGDTLGIGETVSEPMGMGGFPNPHQTSLVTIAGINNAANVKGVYEPIMDHVVFFGNPHDIQYAMYLFAIVNNAQSKAWNDYQGTEPYKVERKFASNDALRTSFMLGMAERLNYRINQLNEEHKPTTDNSRAIVIIKEKKVEELMEDLGIETTSVSTDVRVNESVRAAGDEAGKDVGLHRGIGTTPHKGRLH